MTVTQDRAHVERTARRRPRSTAASGDGAGRPAESHGDVRAEPAPVVGHARSGSERSESPSSSGSGRSSRCWHRICPTPVEGWNAFTDLLADPFHDGGPTDRRASHSSWGRRSAGSFKGFAAGRARWACRSACSSAPTGGRGRPRTRSSRCCGRCRRSRGSRSGWSCCKTLPQAAVFVIFITSLWPIVLNTAAGRRPYPPTSATSPACSGSDGSRTSGTSLVPNSMPSIVTGLAPVDGDRMDGDRGRRDALGRDSGIGFFVWDSYNAANVGNVIAAIILIGLVGVALDGIFVRLGNAVRDRRSNAVSLEVRDSGRPSPPGVGSVEQHVLRGVEPHRRGRRVHLAHRPLRVREVDVAERDRRPARRRCRRGRARRQHRERARARPSDGVPELLAPPAARACSRTFGRRRRSTRAKPESRRGPTSSASAISAPSGCGSTGTSARTRFRAACSSARRWPERSRSSPDPAAR